MRPAHELDAEARQAFWGRMRVPVVAFCIEILCLATIVVVGWFYPGSTASWIVAAITVCMAVTVLLFSMEVRLESSVMRFFSLAGFVWVAILFGMTLLDYWTRTSLR